MIHELHLSATAFHALVRRLGAGMDREAVVPAGLSRLPGRTIWLAHAAAPRSPAAPSIHATASSHGHDPAEILRRMLLDEPGRLALAIALGTGEAAGSLVGVGRVADRLGPLTSLSVVGPGMARVHLEGRTWAGATAGPPPDGLLSRSAGALGPHAFDRMRRLRAAIVGCGRLGSLAAGALAAIGVRELTLIDPDSLEDHDFGEMAHVDPADLGRPKVEALARALRRVPAAAESEILPVVASVLELTALAAIKRAEVLVCAADDPGARLACAGLAACYLKPLLDLGTGVLPGPDGPRMGADCRLVLPGRCLACFGGLSRLAAARDALIRGSTPRRRGGFRAERLGSLRSLNATASGLGQTLLEQLAAGRLRESTWVQLDVGRDGRPRMRHPEPPPRPACPLCDLTASGDEGVERLPDRLETL